MNRFSSKDRISFFHLLSLAMEEAALYNFNLVCTWFHLQKCVLVVEKGRRKNNFSHALGTSRPMVLSVVPVFTLS